MLGVRYNFSKINNDKTNVNYNVNNYSNNGGGSSTMSRKYGNKFNNAASRGVSRGSFSINGKSNHYYIGNPNSNFTQDPFSNVSKQSQFVTKIINPSVKNTKGLLQTRLVNNGLNIKSNSVNSFYCYKKANQELIQKYNQDINNQISQSKAGFNKHFISENKDSSSKIERAKCFVDRSSYDTQLMNKKLCENNKKCNITKDLTAINSYVVGYDVYLTKKKTLCSYNPPDAKIIAC